MLSEVRDELRRVRWLDANFLLNIGPLGDGSVHPEQEKLLRGMGKRIREYGFPT